MEELDLENIMGDLDVENLFSPDENHEEVDKNIEENEQKETNLIEINSDNLFDESESVDEGNKGMESTSDKESSSPNFYSSIAKALSEDGVFLLNEEEISKVNNPEEFKELVESQIKSQLDERQKRINEALDLGIEVSEIRKYENAISYLDSIKETDLISENDQGEALRKQLIKQDFLNRGYDEKRADREVEKSFKSATDIEDAREALKSTLDYFQNQYNSIIESTKESEKEAIKQREEQSKQLQKSIFESSILGDSNWDKTVRQKAFDSISKPIHKDKDTGEVLTAVQKYQRENPNDFLKTVGLLYAVTDGFKELGGLLGKQVNKKVKSSLKELESTLNNTVRTSDGNLKFVTGVNDDPDSKIGKGWNLDV